MVNEANFEQMGAEPGLRDDAGPIEHALGRSRLQTKGDQGRSRIAISRSTERAPLIRASKRHRRISMLEVKRSEEHTSELQSLMRISYAVFCLKKKNTTTHHTIHQPQHAQHQTHTQQ